MPSSVGNRPVKLLTEACCVPQQIQAETGEALGRGNVLWVTKQGSRAGAVFPQG